MSLASCNLGTRFVGSDLVAAVPIVDLFAGPGGLSEGFNSFESDGKRPFRSVAAFEMEPAAHRTLTLRAAFRRTEAAGTTPSDYFSYLAGKIPFEQLLKNVVFKQAYHDAAQETHLLELGPETRFQYEPIIRKALRGSSDWVLIGGPPCQAYSLVGRSRRAKDETFKDDKKHFLYREYLHILEKFQPAVFVMENVKGLLSSKHGGLSMIDKILTDLRKPSSRVAYDVYSLVKPLAGEDYAPRDLVVHAEDYGVPQRRHRIIIVGVRKGAQAPPLLQQWPRQMNVYDAIGDLPRIRSRLSREPDSWEAWVSARVSAGGSNSRGEQNDIEFGVGGQYLEHASPEVPPEADSELSRLRSWILDDRIPGVTHHASRRHRRDDLARYSYLAQTAEATGKVPRLHQLPPEHMPAHKNAGVVGAPFSDRFNVQSWTRPSSTIVCHMSKDGHYYIHPDAEQMRSLTVREAARLQTFPDNYFFEGTQTEQYVQVGNAVPPLLAVQIAESVHAAFTATSAQEATSGEIMAAISS